MLEVLETRDAGAVAERCSARIRGWVEQGWSLEDHLRDVWRPGLDDLAGTPRTVIKVHEVSPTQFRLTLSGERGEGIVTIRFDEDGTLDGFALDREVIDGIANLVINCPDDRVAEMREFYNAVLGDDKWRVPFLVFDEGYDYHAPKWGDPQRPQQIHIDIIVADLDEAEGLVSRDALVVFTPSGRRGRFPIRPCVGVCARVCIGAARDGPIRVIHARHRFNENRGSFLPWPSGHHWCAPGNSETDSAH